MGPFSKFAIRDGLILSITFLGWISLLPLSQGAGLMAEYIGVLLGVMAAICSWVLHEWGHWLAAKAVRAKLRPTLNVRSIYLFGFEAKENSQIQFLIMALGGFIATACVLAGVLVFLPGEMLAVKVFRGLLFLQISVIVLLEIPGFIFGLVAYGRLPSVNVLEG